MFCQLFVIFTLVVWSSSADSDLEKLFKDTKIIPDVLTTAPKEKLKVEFDGLIVGDGEEFTPTQTKDTPKIDWNAEPDAYYTVYMASPDAPDAANPIWGEFLHWLVINVPGKDVEKGDEYSSYLGPLSPKNGGIMRYVFLVYKQPGKISIDLQKVSHNRLEGHPNFKIEKFAEKYNLGTPLAGNIYRSQWDEYVPILHRNMGVKVDE